MISKATQLDAQRTMAAYKSGLIDSKTVQLAMLASLRVEPMKDEQKVINLYTTKGN